MKNTINAMGEKPVFPLLMSMSLPIMISMLIQSLYNVVDSYWVARLGTDAMTAVSLAFPLQNIILAVSVGMGVGISTQVSIYLGRGDRENASRAASLGTALVILNCIIISVSGFFISRPFLSMFTKDEHILSLACDYTQIVLCLSFGMLIQICIEKIFQSVGKMISTMFLMASGCIINMILDPIMIFGLLGMPKMGIKGAAYATVIGQIIAMLLYIIVYKCSDIGIKISFRYAKFNKHIAKQIYSVALPSTLMIGLPSLLTGILNAILVKIGEIYVAIFGLYFKLQTVVNMPASGIIQGMRPVIGYNYGSGDYKRVRKTIFYTLMMIGTISLAGTVVSVAFPAPILKLFDAEPKLLEEGVKAMRIIGISFILSAVAVVVCGVMEALGNGKMSLVISLLRQFVIVIPLGWVLSRFMGASGIWIAFPIAEFITLIVASLCLYRLLTRTLKDIK